MSAASSSPTIELGAASGSTPESADFSGEDVAAAATAAAASCSPGGTVVNGALLRTELRKRQSIRSQQVIATGDRPNVALRRRRKGEPAAKVDRRTTATNGAPRISFHNLYGEADDLEQFRKAGACSKCVDTFFGTTPPPKPCGSCGYQIRWMMSGLFIALLKYVFAITCAHMIHESEDVFKPSISIGVNIQLMCMVVSQLMLAPFTNIGVTIGGPDVVAAIFASAEAHIIAEETHDHPEKALPTLLFCMGLTTFCCSVVWLLIGYFKAARIVDYMPVCVVCGFLGCLAYKVLYYSVKISVGHEWYHPEKLDFWRLLLPVLPLGFGLYYLKKFHHRLNVSPMVFLALFLVVPIVLLYVCIAAVGADMDTLRHDGWLFDEMNSTDFWTAWSELHFNNTDGMAVALCLPSILTTVIVVTIALLINVQASKSHLKLPEIDAAEEMKINGWANLVCTLFLAAPGYTQIKFNLLNYHIIHNKTDKKPGLFAAAFAFVMLVGGFLLINYLPRITLGMLLLYAGLPLLEDNLIFSYKRVTKKEFVAIWVIVLVNAITGVWTPYAFLISVVTGMVLAAVIFAVQYGRNPVIRSVASGCHYTSDVVRPTEKRLLEKIGVRTKIVKLEGFLFFGSTIQVLNKFKAIVDDNKTTPFPQRVRYVILDFTNVKNIDHSSCETFKDIKQIAAPNHISLSFTGINDKLLVKMRVHDVLPKPPKSKKRKAQKLLPSPDVECGAVDPVELPTEVPNHTDNGHHDTDDHDLPAAPVSVHPDLPSGAAHVEERLLERVDYVRSHWLVFNSFRKAHQEARIKTEALIRSSCQTFTAVIGSAAGSDLWKYATIRTLEKGQLLCRQGNVNTTLYMLQEGVMTSFITNEEEYADALRDNHHQTHKRHRLLLLTRGAFVNEECLFTEAEPLKYGVVATRRSVLWAFTRKNRARMQKDHPVLAMEILRKALQHAAESRSRRPAVPRSARSPSAKGHGALSPKTKAQRARRVKQRKSLVQQRLSLAAQRYSNASAKAVRVSTLNVEDLSSSDDEEWHHLDTDHALVVCDKEDVEVSDDESRAPSPLSLGGPASSSTRTPRGSVQCESTDLVSWASSGHHHHAFHHLHMPDARPGPDSPPMRGSEGHPSIAPYDVQPHLSKLDEDEARRCFHVHAELIHLEVDVDSGVITRHQADESHPNFYDPDSPALLALLASPQPNRAGGTTVGVAAAPSSPVVVRQMSEDKYLDLEELEKAVLDLGIYPSHEEIENMHNALCVDHPRKYADLEEFLDMVRALKLANIGTPAKKELYRLFCKYCDDGKLLSRAALAQLMSALGHPEDEVELDTLMLDWDIKGKGLLDFDAFVSIVSTTLKAEEVQVQIEDDFRRFDPKFRPGAKFGVQLRNSESKTGPTEHFDDEVADELLHYRITVDDLLRVHNELGLSLGRDIAEEMLFDADRSGSGGVSYDDLISCIETIDTTEVHRAMEAAANASAATHGGNSSSVIARDD